MSREFVIEIPGASKIAAQFAEAPKKTALVMHNSLKKAAILTQEVARRNAPARTGKLRSSINYRIEGLNAVVGTALNYAIFVHEGTGLYGKNKRLITPTNAKVLATQHNPGWGQRNAHGYFIIGRSSKGQHPNPFMDRARKEVKPQITRIFEAEAQNLLRDLGKI